MINLCIFLLSAVVVEIVLQLIFHRVVANKKKETNLNFGSFKQFSVSEYLGRIEKVAEEIQQEKQKTKYEPTVLWLLIDGLQINEDGSLIWIKKEKPKTLEYFEKVPYSHGGNPYYYNVPYSQFGKPDYYSALLYAENIPVYAASSCNICQASQEQLLRMEYRNLQSQLAAAIGATQAQVTQGWINTFAPIISRK